MNSPCVSLFGYCRAIRSDDSGPDSDCVILIQTFNLCADTDMGIFAADIWSADIYSPYRDMNLREGDMAYLPVESSTRIPA